jgi:hypothetical protein
MSTLSAIPSNKSQTGSKSDSEASSYKTPATFAMNTVVTPLLTAAVVLLLLLDLDKTKPTQQLLI